MLRPIVHTRQTSSRVYALLFANDVADYYEFAQGFISSGTPLYPPAPMSFTPVVTDLATLRIRLVDATGYLMSIGILAPPATSDPKAYDLTKTVAGAQGNLQAHAGAMRIALSAVDVASRNLQALG